MDLHAMAKKLKPVKGQRLAAWLDRFLQSDPAQLAQWQGKFTEVITAKAVDVLRRRGVIEEHEVKQESFACLVQATYRAPAMREPNEKGGS